MKLNAWKAISHTNMSRAIPYRVLATTTAVTCALLVSAYSANAAIIDRTLCLKEVIKPMSGGPVTFWGYTPVPTPTTAKPTPTCADAGVGETPAPPVEVGIGDTLNLTLTLMGGMGGAMPPMEGMMGSKYFGHTIHLHGADVTSLEDGVPETNGNKVTGDTYTWTPTAEMAGTYMYHCHVHTVKHLEMGMYGPLIVVPKDSSGNSLKQLTPDIPGKPTLTTYDFVQTYLFSTVDPTYHTATGDSPVFADYNPAYFLLNGKESIAKDSTGALIPVAAETLTVPNGSKVALRLIGLHSVKGTFSIRDRRDSTGNAIPFTVYVQDGRQYPTPELTTSLDIGPAQRFDIIFTPPAPGSGTWYPQFEYQKLRDASPGGPRIPYATVYGTVTFP